MNKEEILAKSRQENKNRDIAEIDKAKNAARFSLLFSMGFIVIFTILSLFATDRPNYGVIATEFCIVFSMQLYKAVKSKNTADIVCAIISGATFLMLSFIAVCELFGFKP